MSYRASALLLTFISLVSCTGPASTGKPPASAGLSTGTAAPPPVANSGSRAATPPPPASVPETAAPAGPGLGERADVRAFLAEMARRHGLDAAELRRVFGDVHSRPAILEAMAKPYEAKPWHAYRKLFLTEKRINGGREFQVKNAAALAAAERRYGVAPEIVTAIIGIESSYGQNPGKYRVVEALATLSFDYPKRAAFFRKELEQFLLLCREEKLDPLQPVGSYAGAMGMPQFMPSSYRQLAADGDGDGRRDIWNNSSDAIASVARYFSKNGWRTGEPIATRAKVNGPVPADLVSHRDFKPAHSLARLAAAGIGPENPPPGGLKASVIRLDEESGPGYWLGYYNFYVITRYNHSPLYAMAASELSRSISSRNDSRMAP
jgi:membrane-bound lytic murein transglycosylase B